MNKRRRLFWIPFAVITFVAAAGWVVMQLWNHILPGLIPGVGMLSYLKAIGLLMLTRILFGNFGGRARHKFQEHGNWKRKMMGMSEEERLRFKEEWKQRFGR